MNRMTSTAFRVTLMDLEQPVEVTVHGQVIGTWTPIKDAAKTVTPDVKVPVQDGWIKTFTPAPKPGKR